MKPTLLLAIATLLLAGCSQPDPKLAHQEARIIELERRVALLTELNRLRSEHRSLDNDLFVVIAERLDAAEARLTTLSAQQERQAQRIHLLSIVR